MRRLMRFIAVFAFAAILLVTAGCGSKPSNQKYLPIHYAASIGDVAQVRARLGESSCVNAVEDGLTPIYRASTREVAKVLIDAGADVNARTTETEPVYCFAHTTGVTPLCLVGSAEVAVVLIDHGAKVNATDSEGRQPLHYQAALASSLSSARGRLEVMEVLLANGGDVEALSKGRFTPLMAAAAGGNIDAMKLLIQKGSKIDHQDDKGWTPLYYSASTGRWDAVRFLLENGADAAIRNNDGDDILAHIRKETAAPAGFSFEGALPADLEELLRLRTVGK